MYKSLIVCSLILNCLCYELTKSNDRVIVEGNDLEMECTLQAAIGESFSESQLMIQWVKTDDEGNIENITLNDQLEVNDERYQVNLDFDESSDDDYIRTANYKLIINDIEESDEGEYHCEVLLANSDYENSAVINIHVLSYEIELNVLTGDDTFLECVDETYNVSNVNYLPNRGIFKEGSYIEDDRVKLNDVTLDMAMVYFCNASLNNANNDNIYRAIYLHVLKPLEVYTLNTMVKRRVNDDVVLTCFIYSFTPVSVKWTNKQGQIENTDRFAISLEENENYLTNDDSANYRIFSGKFLKMSKLEIKNITTDDKGPYLCSVSNIYDNENQRFVVKVKNETITTPDRFPKHLKNLKIDDIYLDELSDETTTKKPLNRWIDNYRIYV